MMDATSDFTIRSRRIKSRVEINFNRLIVRCEQMALNAENCTTDPENWRLEKYMSSLEAMLNELKDALKTSHQEQLQEYTARVEFLKDVLNTAKLPSLPEKVIASELIKPAQITTPVASPGISSPVEIKHRHNTKYAEDLRRELLGDSPVQSGDSGGEGLGASVNDLVKYHHSIQEKIADHMLELTKTLKEQVTIAGEVVRKDTEVLEKSGSLIDRNQENLRIETEKLAMYNKRACKCWIWLMLVFVCSVFVGKDCTHPCCCVFLVEHAGADPKDPYRRYGPIYETFQEENFMIAILPSPWLLRSVTMSNGPPPFPIITIFHRAPIPLCFIN